MQHARHQYLLVGLKLEASDLALGLGLALGLPLPALPGLQKRSEMPPLEQRVVEEQDLPLYLPVQILLFVINNS
jgi:hypothetical protein